MVEQFGALEDSLLKLTPLGSSGLMDSGLSQLPNKARSKGVLLAPGIDCERTVEVEADARGT